MFIGEPHDRLLVLAAQIASAHVGNNNTTTEELPGLIKEIYETLASIGPSEPRIGHAAPAHNHGHSHAAGQAGTDDFMVCLEDGLPMKMLKRHLLTVHELTPDQYRAKWGLPGDYPMVAANYAKLRSSLAKESGLGLRPEARPKRRRF